MELHPDTARAYGIENGDRVRVENELGSVILRAKCTAKVRPDDVYAFHSYSEADINDLYSNQNLDPYTGFPSFRLTHCRIVRVREEGEHGTV